MNPNSNEAPGIELPPSVAEPLPALGGAESATQPAEMAPAAPERSPSVQAAPSGAATPAIPLPAPPIMPVDAPQAAAPAPASAGLPQVDDDGDLIEKEWVNKAKHIVETTRDDPHKQSEELTVVKADYMKKRYGKTIKLSQ